MIVGNILRDDGWKSRDIKDVLNWNREQDTRDLRRNDLNELLENMMALSALEEKSWKSDESGTSKKSWISEKSNQKIVMNEKFAIVMHLPILKFGGWNNLQRSSPKLLDELLMRTNRGC